jgi:large subunit ribosomal protein L6
LSVKVINKKSKKTANSFKAHIKNMVKGANEGHIYKLKICSGHFPMTVSLKGETLEIKNFIGEKVPRTLKVLEGTTVKVDGTEIIVESINKEKAGHMAASIEQLTRRPGFDRRIFQDGIYIVEKDGKIIG